MSPRTLTLATIGLLLSVLGPTASAAEVVITDGIAVDVRQVIDPNPQGQPGPAIGDDVQDMSDGSTNEGGVPEGEVDLRDAAIRGEKNLGPNAPGYIP